MLSRGRAQPEKLGFMYPGQGPAGKDMIHVPEGRAHQYKESVKEKKGRALVPLVAGLSTAGACLDMGGDVICEFGPADTLHTLFCSFARCLKAVRDRLAAHREGNTVNTAGKRDY